MEKKYIVLAYRRCAEHNSFFETEGDLEHAKLLARAVAAYTDESFYPFTITKVKLLDISNNEEIEY